MTPGHRLNRIIREQGLINAGFAKSIGVVQYDVSILTSGVSSAAGGAAGEARRISTKNTATTSVLRNQRPRPLMWICSTW